MPYGAALDRARRRRRRPRRRSSVTVPEGRSRREEAAKIRSAGLKGSYLAATKRSPKLDPRDYGAPRSTRVARRLPVPLDLRAARQPGDRRPARQPPARRLQGELREGQHAPARRKNLSRYDVLIIASMIEREALVPRDRRLIAAVIYNRLKEGMPLGIDATLRFALNQWSRPLRVSELNSNSAFNTRKHDGLPPTPIGSPGLAAMRAAANPAKRVVPLLRRQAVRQRRARVLLDRREVPAATSPSTTARARGGAARTRRGADPATRRGRSSRAARSRTSSRSRPTAARR